MARGLGPIGGGCGIIPARPGALLGTARQVRIVERPLHRIERFDQHGLARCGADRGLGLFVGRHQDQTPWIAEFDQAGEDGQPRRVVGADGEVELGAPDGGGRWHGLHLQWFAAAHPKFAAQHPQEVVQRLGGGRDEAGRRVRSHLPEFQLAVGVQLELRPVRQQDRHPAIRAGFHGLAGGQHRAGADRSPAAFTPDFDRAQHADDLAGFPSQRQAFGKQYHQDQQTQTARPARMKPPEWMVRSASSTRHLAIPSID